MNKIKKIIVNNIASSNLIPTKVRIKIYKFCGLNIKNHAIFPNCFFEGSLVEIKKGSWVNRDCYFDCESASIKIGENCGIGMQVLFCTSSHEIGNEEKRARDNIKLPIEIGDGCWIGARATILPGVKIGNGCVIAVGSVVTNGCEPNGLYAGVPARRIKDL